MSGALLLIALVAAVVAISSVWFSKATVPDVRGATSAFIAQRRILAAGLVPGSVESGPSREAPGTVLDQTPGPGEKLDKGSKVALLIAVGIGDTTVPDLSGVNLLRAEELLRKAALQHGQVTPESSDRSAVVASQIPAAGEIVKEGTVIDLFLQSRQPLPSGGGGGG